MTALRLTQKGWRVDCGGAEEQWLRWRDSGHWWVDTLISHVTHHVAAVRDDLRGNQLPVCPKVWNYQVMHEKGSMLNTPPTWRSVSHLHLMLK